MSDKTVLINGVEYNLVPAKGPEPEEIHKEHWEMLLEESGYDIDEVFSFLCEYKELKDALYKERPFESRKVCEGIFLKGEFIVDEGYYGTPQINFMGEFEIENEKISEVLNQFLTDCWEDQMAIESFPQLQNYPEYKKLGEEFDEVVKWEKWFIETFGEEVNSLVYTFDFDIEL